MKKNDLSFCTLISCMFQDKDIIHRSNVQTDVVVVNQCDENSVEEFVFTNKKGKECRAKFICTTERGLSRSRNMAIQNSYGEICLICDDDEILEDNIEDIVLPVYKDNEKPSLILFALRRKDCDKTYPTQKSSVGFRQILQSSSLQITFRKNKLMEKNIHFDEKMGSGTGNGGGEENKFLLDSRRKGLNILYVPNIIATVLPSASQWFKGYTEEYFRNMGWVSRRSMGNFLGLCYIMYFALSHHKLFSSDVSFHKALKYLLMGYMEKR